RFFFGTIRPEHLADGRIITEESLTMMDPNPTPLAPQLRFGEHLRSRLAPSMGERNPSSYDQVVITFLGLGTVLYMTAVYGEGSGVIGENTTAMVKILAFVLAAWPGYYAFRRTIGIPIV